MYKKEATIADNALGKIECTRTKKWIWNHDQGPGRTEVRL